VVALFVTLGVGVWALAVVAAAQPRYTRWLLAAVVLLSAGVTATVHTGASVLAEADSLITINYPAIDLGVPRINHLTLAVATVPMALAGGALLAPISALRRRPVATGLVVSSPIWGALLTWILSAHHSVRLHPALVRGLDRSVAEALQGSAAATSLYFLIPIASLGMIGVLAVLALLDAGEVVRAKMSLASQIGRYLRLTARPVLLLALAAKLLFLAVGYLGWLPGGDAPGQVWDIGSGIQWLYALIMVSLAALVIRAVERRPLVPERLRSMSAVVVAGFGAAGLCAMAVALILASGGALVRGGWKLAFIRHGLDVATTFAVWGPLVTVVSVGALGVLWRVRRGGWSAGALLGLAVLVWGTVPAAQVATGGGRVPAGMIIASLQRLDVIITLVVAVMIVRWPQALPSSTLLTVLVVSTLVAYGGELMPDNVRHKLFLVALVAPVVWRFGIDTSDLRDHPPGRVVAAVVGWSVFLALSAVVLASGSVGEGGWSPSQRLGWRLLIVPLAFVLVCRSAAAETRAAPGWHDGPGAPVAAFPERRGAHVGGALVGVGVLIASVLAFSRGEAIHEVHRPAHRVDAKLPQAWLPCYEDKLADGETVVLAALDASTVVLAAHGRPGTLLIDETFCGGTLRELFGILNDRRCIDPRASGASPAIVAGLAGAQFTLGPGLLVQCAYRSDPRHQQLVMALDRRPQSGALRTEVAAAVAGITFPD
jgi:hypothetical protein